MPDLDRLAARWHALTAPFEPAEARRTATFRQLAAAYSAPSRHYHTLRHVETLLDQLEPLPLHDAPVVLLAVWFHDAVYEALRSDNETRSAALAREFLAPTRLAPARQQRVAFLIERTANHALPQPPDDPDLLHFLDADLSILGAPPAEYQAYAQQVRREYRRVPDLLYRPGRRKVLAGLLAAPALYRTPAQHTALEAVARRNLRDELAALG